MSRPFLFAACALLALSVVGCKSKTPKEESKEAGPTRSRVVLNSPERDPQGEPLQTPEWFDEEIKTILALREDGRMYEAVKRAYAAREQRPAGQRKRMIDELLMLLNNDVLRLETLGGQVLAERDPIEFGEPLAIRVRLENLGPRPIRVPAKRENTSGSLFVLEIERREYDVRAQVVTTQGVAHLELPVDLELAPGGVVEVPLELGMQGNDRPLAGFRIYRISGVLRPTMLDAGGMRRWEAIEILEGTVRSFRPNFEHLADDPVARIEQAIPKDASVHLLTAAALVPDDRRTEAVDLLVANVRGDRFVDWAIFGALRYLTNIELGRDADAWRAWWPRVRETYFAHRPGAGPVTAVPKFGE